MPTTTVCYSALQATYYNESDKYPRARFFKMEGLSAQAREGFSAHGVNSLTFMLKKPAMRDLQLHNRVAVCAFLAQLYPASDMIMAYDVTTLGRQGTTAGAEPEYDQGAKVTLVFVEAHALIAFLAKHSTESANG